MAKAKVGAAGIEYIQGAMKRPKKVKRTTPITADEAAARLRFSTVAAMVKQRKGDLTKIAADQAAFLEQKDLAGGKKTLKAYYWKICGDAYDESLANG